MGLLEVFVMVDRCCFHCEAVYGTSILTLRIAIILFVLLNDFHINDALLTATPRDTEVKINDSTYMNCSTSLLANQVQWRHQETYLVYDGLDILEPYDGRFSVDIDASTGACNLVIRSAQSSDAGKYKCTEDEGAGKESSAQLMVLDADPVCESNMHSEGVIGPNSCDIKPDDIQLSCSVTYHGNILPILQWKERGNNQSIAEGLFNITSNQNEVTNTLTVNSKFYLDNVSFICQTTRSSGMQYGCSSDIIKIIYVFSSKVAVNMTLDDEVNCVANTSQSCSYKWKWFNDDDSITVSSNRILRPERVGGHRCEATCSIGNRSCTVQSMYAEAYSNPAPSRQMLLLLLLLLLVPLFAGIIAVIYWCRKKKAKLTQEDAIPMTNTPERQQTEEDICSEIKIEYKVDPVLLETFQTKEAKKLQTGISGLVVVDTDLFITTFHRNIIEVYELNSLRFKKSWKLDCLTNPFDLGYCIVNKWLYVMDGNESKIIRVDRNGELPKMWSTGRSHGCLSVAYDCNVLMADYEGDKITEYKPDGQIVREIILSTSAGFNNLRYALKMTDNLYLMSHGDGEDPLHRVCVVNTSGNIRTSFGGLRGSTSDCLNVPIYLTIDPDGSIFVVDRDNSQVLLLSSDLQLKRVIIPRNKEGMKRPERIAFDHVNGRLLVVHNAEGWRDCRVFVFKIT